MKNSFPLFKSNPDITYLDSAATALKPESVLQAVREYYTTYSANVSRGLYPLSERATAEYERVRGIAARFLRARSSEEIVFTRGATESLNLLAYTLLPTLRSGDSIAVTAMEHHANFVPWLELAKRFRVELIVIPVDQDGEIRPGVLKNHITPKTRIFSFVHASNVLGTINPAKELVAEAKRINPDIITIIDAAQSAPHIPIDVQDIGCDFLTFSSHKVFGPTGAGVLWGRKDRLNSLTPFLYGGEMVESVTEERAVFKEAPHKFEAGTPPIAEVIGMGAALEYIRNIGFDAIRARESELAEYTFEKLTKNFGGTIHILGPTTLENRVPLFAFTLDGVHPHDAAQVLAEENICIRAGSHCAMPIHRALLPDSPATARISLSIYNTKEDIDKCVEALKKARNRFVER